jgi:hypothetical protein
MPDLSPAVTPARRTRAAWYFLALVPIALGAGVAGLTGLRLYGAVKDMPRVVVPGAGDVTLDAGDYVGYLEGRTVVDGTSYSAATLSVQCAVTGAGGPVALASGSSTSTSYSLGDYAGQSAYTLTIPTAGAYHVACNGQGAPGALAFGHGIGTQIVTAVIAGLGGVFGAIVVVFLVRRRRKRR